ncbi:hypothetical protein [Algirhabdus cladophorae]|uniref:hypothetical protein n=1 Tax=Algirhabdus cladophorae TaxID=3377108 RepID=UPI003B84A810
MRFFIFGAMILGLAGCDPAVPNSGAPVPVGQGVGFNNYDAYLEAQRQREAAIAAQAAAQVTAVPAAPEVTGTTLTPASRVLSTETVSATQQAREQAGASVPQAAAPQIATSQPVRQPLPVQTSANSSATSSADDAREIAAQTQAALANSGVAPVQASPSNPAPEVVQVNTAGISNENDFNAVSQRDSIKGNAERLRQQREQYQVVQPTALPTRTGGNEPNIVKYALETRNARGQAVYRRTGFNLRAKHARACAAYPSADLAQEAFLAAGGPQRDRNALDIDGDGFACSWDPAPFRRAFR